MLHVYTILVYLLITRVNNTCLPRGYLSYMGKLRVLSSRNYTIFIK